MVVVLIATVFVGVLVYRRIKKRRARKRAIKLARSVILDATEDEVIIIERESSRISGPPPYSTPSPQDPHLMVPGFEPPGIRDKPPSYSAAILQVQNS